MTLNNSKILYKSSNRKLKIKNIEPERLSKPSDGYFVFFTIFFSWFFSLLGYEKLLFDIDILLIIIVFWCIYEPFQIGLYLAFFFGILLDVHSTSVIGKNALFYILVIYLVSSLRRRILRFDVWGQTFHMIPIFFISKLASQLLEAWLYGYWIGWKWAIGPVLDALLWPLACWFLLMLQRSKNGNDNHVN